MKRLQAMCGLINKCTVLADIGCDHGFVSKYVLENNLADKVIATDISPKCLNKARILLQDYKNIEFICIDGLNGISADIAVIAGMGGHTIINILSGKLDGTVYILQPQDHCNDLRFFLTQNGYRIIRDILVKENNKYYDILLTEKGEQSIDEFQVELGVYYKESKLLLKQKTLKQYEKFCKYNDGGKNEGKRIFLKEALSRIEIGTGDKNSD